jgi:hypothetical protein
MAWKLQLFTLIAYLILILGGFKLLPREPAMFGMGMVPGGMTLFSTIGLPVLLSIGFSIWVYKQAPIRKIPNTLLFVAGSMIVWLCTFLLAT